MRGWPCEPPQLSAAAYFFEGMGLTGIARGCGGQAVEQSGKAGGFLLGRSLSLSRWIATEVPITYCFAMTQKVSVPEKTLEHWASLCVAYRYSSLAAQWRPVNGVDIDLQALPAQPGKAIQLELKTITPVGPGRHKVHIDLGQLWEYIGGTNSGSPWWVSKAKVRPSPQGLQV